MKNESAHNYISGTTAVKIAESIERAIQDERLGPGTLLPPVRGLAGRLGVSAATVAAAYKMLRTRGLLVGDGRRGTRTSPKAGAASRTLAPIPKGVRDLSYGNPDPELLPSLESAISRIDPRPRLYVRELVHPDLRKAAEKEFSRDGIPVHTIGVVGGAFDGIERVLRERLRPGDKVGVEDPGFTGVFDLLTSLGHSLVPVAMDEEGFLPTAMERALRQGVRGFVYTPRAQNPLGAALTERRAAALRKLLAGHPDLLLVEDDHAGSVSGQPAISLVTPKHEAWAIIRSMSKALGPDLRLAFMTGDAITMERLHQRQHLGMRWVSHILQQIVAHFLGDAKMRRQLELATARYGERREALIGALGARDIPAFGRSGFNVWIPVVQEAAVCQALLSRGWAVRAGEGFRLESPPAVRATVSTLLPEEAVRFAADLARVLRPERGSFA